MRSAKVTIALPNRQEKAVSFNKRTCFLGFSHRKVIGGGIFWMH
jgi:hypothetical protein